MKTNHQAPTSKHQRSFKHQRAESAKARRVALKYPAVAVTALVLNETTDANGAPKHPFDLEERTARFGEAIVRFSKKIPRDPANDRLIDQLVGCATSYWRELLRSQRRHFEKGFSPHDLSLREGSERNKVFSSDACGCRTAACRRSPQILSRGQGIAPDLREYFSEN
jgi:hypothetical protein